jgi:hypothetical protein
MFVVVACSSRPDGVMSQREMRLFLTDLHLLEGVLSQHPEIAGDDRLQVYYYNALFEKHGITKANFDSSLVYYTKQPKRFERIYANVTRELELLEKDVIDGKYELAIPDSILKKPTITELPALAASYRFTPDSTRTKLAFAVKTSELMTRDVYHLRFRMRREPRDSSEGVYAALRIHYAGGGTDSLSYPIKNDSILRRYHFQLMARRNLPIDSLSGVLLGAKSTKGQFRITVDSISLKREYRVFMQDSLRSQLDSIPALLPDSGKKVVAPTSKTDTRVVQQEATR